jgi:hypothetical protein
LKYLAEGKQIERHEQMMNGTAGNPWQYRPLSAYLVEGLRFLYRSGGTSNPHVFAFVAFRFLVDVAIFLAVFTYFCKLGLSFPHTMIGIMILAWGISYSHFDSDLQFSTFLDVLFYILAGTAILSKTTFLIFPITLLAAFNRETSGLIPVMYLAAALVSGPPESRFRTVRFGGLCLAAYVLVFVGLRIAYGEQELILAYGHMPGLDMFRYNICRFVTWWQCLATLGIIPFLALAGYRCWPPQLRVFFWVVVPAWFAVHLTSAVMAETRLLLVPQALVFIPGALFFCRQTTQGNFDSVSPS